MIHVRCCEHGHDLAFYNGVGGLSLPRKRTCYYICWHSWDKIPIKDRMKRVLQAKESGFNVYETWVGGSDNCLNPPRREPRPFQFFFCFSISKETAKKYYPYTWRRAIREGREKSRKSSRRK